MKNLKLSDQAVRRVARFLRKSQEFLEDEFAGEDEPDEGDIFIQPDGPLGSRSTVFSSGEAIGTFDDYEEMEEAIKEWMDTNNYWPNIWRVSDHGNIHLHTLD